MADFRTGLIKNQTRYVYFLASGNCNFAYATGIREYVGRPEVAIGHMLTVSAATFTRLDNRVIPELRYNKPHNGIYLFAQGSKDPVSTRPYAKQLAAAIKYYGLGKVVEIGPVLNPQHTNRPGWLYVWHINEPACRKWWTHNVLNQKRLLSSMLVKKEKKCPAPLKRKKK